MSNDKVPSKIPYEEARDTVILWKKGKKNKPDPIHFINAAWNLANYHNGSFDAASQDVKDISPRMLRKLASAAEVTATSDIIKNLLRNRKLSLDVTADLAGIKDDILREKVAKIVAGMKALDQRQVVSYAKKYPESSFEQFKNRVLSSKDSTEKIYMALLPFNQNEYLKLKTKAKEHNMSWDELSMNIITQWLERGGHRSELA